MDHDSSDDDDPAAVSSAARWDDGLFRRWPGAAPATAGLVVGTPGSRARRASIGFRGDIPDPDGDDSSILRLAQPGHGMVMAGTGQGKLVNVIAPNILVHDGPLIVVDPKGEIAAVTARHRRSIGDVVILDPFAVLGTTSGSLNPLDFFGLPGADFEDGAEALAWEMSSGHESTVDQFWQNAATSLLTALIASAAADPEPSQRHIGTAIDLLFSADVDYSVAVLLDGERIHSDFAVRRLQEYLQTPSGGNVGTRGCILVTAQHYLHCMMASRVRRCVESSTYSLADLLEGERPSTLYLVFPPEFTTSHRGLLRLWLTTILRTVMHRRTMPRRQTLLVVDDAANLGRIDLLPEMHSFARAKGCSILTAWQSYAQIVEHYKQQARTICENCSVIQAFGLHAIAVDSVAILLGVAPALVRGLTSRQQLVAVGSQEPLILGRVDYRTHPELAGLADANPCYGRRFAGDEPGREEAVVGDSRGATPLFSI